MQIITIADGRGALWQWDTGRRVKITDGVGVKQIHYQNKCFGRSVDVDVGADGTAIIPDELLQDCHTLTAYAYVTDDAGGYTKVQQDFAVYKRAKPAGYTYTPTDQMTLQTIQRQIGDLADLETNTKSDLVAAINEAIEASGGGGGGGAGLPSGGTPYQQLVTDGNGKTQWEDRLAYASGYEEKEFLPEQTYSGDGAILSGDGVPVIGKTYSVMFDGAEYDCICVIYESNLSLGNASLWDIGDDTGEPFLLQFYDGAIHATSSDLLANHTISISYVDENIKIIDKKFLPKDFIVNIIGEEQGEAGEKYLLFDKTDEEIYNASQNGSTVKLNYENGYELQYNSYEGMFWGIFPRTTGTNGITELNVLYVSNGFGGWCLIETYINASTASNP